MFCPKCGTENIENASFCRSCGADIRLVPQAMSGLLPAELPDAELESETRKRRGRRRKGAEANLPSLEKGIENIFIGVAFILVALAVWRFMPGGFVWWFWLLIPALACLGTGVAHLVRLKYTPVLPPSAERPALSPARPAELTPPPARTPAAGELVTPPASVTEGTTRHLSALPRSPREKL